MQALARQFDRLAVFVLLIIVEGVFWPPEAYFSRAPDALPTADPYSTVFNAVLIAFLAVACLARGRSFATVLRAAWPMLPLIALGFASAFWSPVPDIVLVRATKIAATALFGVYLIARADMAGLVSLFVKANLVAAVACFVTAVVAPQFVFSTNVEYTHAWRGAFTDKNELGVVAAFGILFAVYAFRRGYGSRFLSGLAVPLDAVLLYLSDSRTPLVLLPIALYVALAGGVLRRRSGFGMAAGFALVVLGLAGAAAVAGLSDEILAALGRTPTLSNRTHIWQVIVPYIARRPWLGYGLESFWRPHGVEANQVWQILQWRTPHSHNLWLEIGLSLGLIGIAAAALLWASALWRGLRALFVAPVADAVFSLAVLLAIFGDNLAEYAFFRGDSILWLLFAATYAHLGRELLARRLLPASRPMPAPRLPLGAAPYPGTR